jgi:hypothetical protein
MTYTFTQNNHNVWSATELVVFEFENSNDFFEHPFIIRQKSSDDFVRFEISRQRTSDLLVKHYNDGVYWVLGYIKPHLQIELDNIKIEQN